MYVTVFVFDCVATIAPSPCHLAIQYSWCLVNFICMAVRKRCTRTRTLPLTCAVTVSQVLPIVPLDRMMLETDAPYMGFVKHRRGSEPADVVGIAQRYVRTCVVVAVAAAAVVVFSFVAVVFYTS